MPENRYQYNGKEWEEEFGLYDCGARYYDPAIGRWMQVDLLAELMPSMTPFRFGFNNPISWSDPWGLFETRKEAKEHKRKEKLNGKVRKQEDGSFGIENKKSGSVTFEFTDSDGVKSVITGGTVKADALHLARIGMDAAVEIADRNPDAVLKNDWFDIAYYWGKALSFAAPTAKLPTVAKAPTVGAKRNYAGKSFRGGKKSQRDPYIAGLPEKFRRWFHRYWKDEGAPNASKKDINEALEAWKQAGKPNVK